MASSIHHLILFQTILEIDACKSCLRFTSSLSDCMSIIYDEASLNEPYLCRTPRTSQMISSPSSSAEPTFAVRLEGATFLVTRPLATPIVKNAGQHFEWLCRMVVMKRRTFRGRRSLLASFCAILILASAGTLVLHGLSCGANLTKVAFDGVVRCTASEQSSDFIVIHLLRGQYMMNRDAMSG